MARKKPTTNSVNGLSIEHKRTDKKESDSVRSYTELQQNFETVLNLMDGFILIFSKEGKLLYSNPETIAKLGYDTGNVYNLTVFDFYPENKKDFCLNLLHQNFEKEAYQFDLPLVHKEGRFLSMRTKVKSCVWQNEEAKIFYLTDTTTVKRLEIELSMLSHALRNVSESLSVFDLNGNIIFVNDSFIKTYGYEKEELIGQSINKFHPSTNPRQIFKPIIEKTLKENWEGELTAKRKSGDVFSIYIRTSPVMDENGKPIVIIGVARDITEKKLLEDQLRQSQKMEAIGQLAGGIAHDFNNLLTVIEGYTELLFSSILETEPAYNFTKQIKKASDRATALTRQLLAFSRRQILQPKNIDLNVLVTDMGVLLKRLIGEDIELSTVLNPEIGSIKADRSQMEQVLMNLAVNARDAMPEGGQLIIETSKVSLDAQFEWHHSGLLKGNYVVLSISDTGVGMDEETKEHVFEPFFTTKEKAKGTGLGLATVYGIVKQSGGHIWVDSQKGKGTTFKIYLPMIKSRKKSSKTDSPISENKSGTETILVVEDEFMVRELVCDSLKNSGYTILEASNGKEAIEIFNNNSKKIDLILTDVIMPSMSGRKMVEILQEKYPGINALYMSGYTDDAIIKHGVLEPGMAYIQKPFSPKALIQKVQEVLEGE